MLDSQPRMEDANGNAKKKWVDQIGAALINDVRTLDRGTSERSSCGWPTVNGDVFAEMLIILGGCRGLFLVV